MNDGANAVFPGVDSESYRSVGLYWAGSIGGSMLVLIPGIFIGESLSLFLSVCVDG